MSRDNMTEEVFHAHRRRRARRARMIRRIRGFLLAIALMTALALYAGDRAAHGAAESSPAPGRDRKVSQLEARSPSAPSEASQEPEGGAFTNQELEQLASDTLAGIVTEGMTQLEQARAVFDYVHDNIRYTGSSDKSDWESGAYEGLTSGKGDCFTYYAASRAMLTVLGIDNLPVERVGGENLHFWNLVNCGEGWYHFDACPRSSRLPAFDSFMFTDRQAADFTAEAGRCYYDFDGTLLPERAEEILPAG